MQNGTSFLIRLLITALAVILTSYLLPGVHVESFLSALILSLLLALLNVTLKPILVIITIPVTFLTLGLFLLVINALMILLADAILPGFIVDGFWWALLFSIVLWVINSLLRSLVR
jgi:putative membrane protein